MVKIQGKNARDIVWNMKMDALKHDREAQWNVLEAIKQKQRPALMKG